MVYNFFLLLSCFLFIKDNLFTKLANIMTIASFIKVNSNYFKTMNFDYIPLAQAQISFRFNITIREPFSVLTVSSNIITTINIKNELDDVIKV